MTANPTYDHFDLTHEQDGAEVRILPAKTKPCARCPYLVANFDKIGEPPLENEGTYLPSTRASLWHHGTRQDGGSLGSSDLMPSPDRGDDGLRGGIAMRCHIRRQDTPARPESILFPRPACITACMCTSGLVLQQRELLRYISHGPTPAGLTAQGAARVAGFMLGRDVTVDDLSDVDVKELLERAHPALLDPAIGHEELAPLSARELREWSPR